MKQNKRENLGQTIRNYENIVNMLYFVYRLFVYFNHNCELQYQEIIRVERCMLLLGLLLGKLVGGIYYLLGYFYIINYKYVIIFVYTQKISFIK